MDPDKHTWTCPNGLTACSTNTTLGGSTFCVSDPETECPVTDLVLLNKNSTSYKLDKNSGYTKHESGHFLEEHRLYLAFTTQTNERSNEPLEHIYWANGYPCQFEYQ